MLTLGGLTPGVVTPAEPADGGITVRRSPAAWSRPRRRRRPSATAPPGVLTAGAATGGVVTEPEPTDGGVTVAPPTGGVVTVWAPAVPAAATRARVDQGALHQFAFLLAVGTEQNAEAAERSACALPGFATLRRRRASVVPTNEETHEETPVYDYIIVGGGSAGSVMAHRLSARSANKVLLCEAGQDTPPGKEPPEIADSYSGTAYFDPRFHWTELKVHTQVVSHNNPQENRPPLRKYEQARVLGGGSSINGQMANRGAPTDYDEWASRGAEGWGWNEVLPYFKKVERDLDFDGPWHGKDGRIPVRRIPPEHWTGHAKAVAKAFEAKGFKFLPDQNGEFVEGYFPVTHSNAEERRVSAAMGYLDAETRKRSNLTISTDTQVKSLLFEGTRCVGVTAMVAGKEQEFRAPRGDPVVGRDPLAGASDARRHRPGRAAAASSASR